MAVMDLVDMSKFPDELVKNINGIIARCTSQGQKVSGAEEVLNLLKGAGLLWEVQGAPEFTGVSRFNRKSYMVLGQLTGSSLEPTFWTRDGHGPKQRIALTLKCLLSRIAFQNLNFNNS